jgi:predicted permease
VLLFSAVIALVTGILFGLSPALELSRSHFGFVVQAGSMRVAGSIRARRMHRLPIAGQVALTLLLLAGASAAAKALLAKMHTLRGFDPDHVFSMPVHLPIKAITKHGGLEEVRPEGIDELITQQETVRSAISHAPGVAEAGLSSAWFPGFFALSSKIEIKGRPTLTDAQDVTAPISPQLFSVFRIPLLRGRIFDGLEVQRQAHVAVVNQAFLKQYLEEVDPIGQRVRLPVLNYSYPSLSADRWMEVIGVVGDATNDNLEHPRVRPAVFIPSSFGGLVPGVNIYVRASGDPETAIRSVRARLRELDPDLVVVYARTLQSDLSWEWAREQLLATILSLYGGVALVLAATGLYSVVSFAVTQRTQELGIRIALGAGRGSIARLVLSSTAAMLGIGVLAGLILSAIVSPVVSTWGGGRLSQPLTLFGAALVLALVATVACVLPAWRAASSDLMKVLRAE